MPHADVAGRIHARRRLVVGRQVTDPHFERIHVELGGQVIDGLIGEEAVLWMARGSHGARRLDVHAHDLVLAFDVGHGHIHVWQQIEVDRGAAADARRTVAIDLKGPNVPGTVGGDLDGAVGRGTHAADCADFLGAVEHQLDGRCALRASSAAVVPWMSGPNLLPKPPPM